MNVLESNADSLRRKQKQLTGVGIVCPWQSCNQLSYEELKIKSSIFRYLCLRLMRNWIKPAFIGAYDEENVYKKSNAPLLLSAR